MKWSKDWKCYLHICRPGIIAHDGLCQIDAQTKNCPPKHALVTLFRCHNAPECKRERSEFYPIRKRKRAMASFI